MAYRLAMSGPSGREQDAPQAAGMAPFDVAVEKVVRRWKGVLIRLGAGEPLPNGHHRATDASTTTVSEPNPSPE